jgi:hypothetical protein
VGFLYIVIEDLEKISMSKILLNLLVYFFKVLQNSKSIENSKVKSFLKLPFESSPADSVCRTGQLSLCQLPPSLEA